MANLVTFKKQNSVKKDVKPLFKGASKGSTSKGVKYTLSNNNFFTENHQYFGVCSKKYFQDFDKALNNEQKLGLWLFFNNLTNGVKMKISEVRFTKKDNLSYVSVRTTHDGKDVEFNMFYFHGLHKLLSFASFVKYNLNLKELTKIAKQK